MAADSNPSYQLVTALFLRLLGFIYLIAFASIGVQIEGLVGSRGILPFSQELLYLQGQMGMERYFLVPNLFWLNASDVALTAAAMAGCSVSVLIILNRWSRLCLIAAFILYLSLYTAGQLFLNFQWDGLLLEAGFLAIFLTPASRVVILLFRWLLFRLRFMSGLSKLTMQDPGWSGLTALNSYFEVQPLPTPLAWYAHQLPDWLLKTATAATLVIEILVPLMMFLPRRWRFVAAWITIIWQLLIMLTSNHNWFNILTIVLCLFLFDDEAIQSILPQRLRTWLRRQPGPPASGGRAEARRIMVVILATLILLASSAQFWELATMQHATGAIGRLVEYAEAYRVVNKYHVFPTMRSERIELQLSGSHDGREWKNYQFKYKPGDPGARPAIVLPHQPRLDWEMWFVTQHPKYMHFFHSFLQALLNNSPAVTTLLRRNPFSDRPPRYIRVEAYKYRFSTPDERQKTGQWWQREALGPFTPLPWLERE
jgi:lipase maturation factor 1